MRLALHNLLQDRFRLALSVVGIALAVMLMLFLLGLRQGVFRSTVIYLDNAPGSVAVMPAGVTSSHGHGQFLSPETLGAISATPGVARVAPVQLQQAALELHGKKEIVQLVGYKADRGGGPWDLAAGRDPQTDNEIVLDRVLANRHGFRVGDSFQIKGLQLKVAGLSNETSTFTGAYVFARMSFVEQLTLAPGGATYALVTPAPGASQSDLIAALKTLPGTNVVPKTTITANDRKIIAQILDQIVYLMVAAAFIVGALVVGMVIYSATSERRSEYGILKAIGARSGVLYRVVAWQALIAAGAGSLLGVGFAFAMGTLVTHLKPQFLVSIEPSAIEVTLLAGFVMAFAGALVPARSVTSLAPGQVFRR
jgi:putative ABC transport system permease protein